MELLGIRFCSVNKNADEMINFFQSGLGLKNTLEPSPEFFGGIFPDREGGSWVEVWQESEQMPEGVMLQLVVADADKTAEHAKGQGLELSGPVDAHGERIYYAKTPSGMNVSFQSKL